MRTYRVITPEQARRLVDTITDLPLPLTVTVTEGEIKRTTAQNSLLHQWFGQIAKHRGDCTMLDVKGECHHRWGLPIKMRYVQFAWIWERTGAHLDYEKQCGFLACPEIKVSSAMTVKELSEYMDAMQLHYRAEGVVLTDPDALKYEGEAA